MEQFYDTLCEFLDSIGLTKKNAIIIVSSVIAFWVWIGKPRTSVRRAAPMRRKRATRKATTMRKRRAPRRMYRRRK